MRKRKPPKKTQRKRNALGQFVKLAETSKGNPPSGEVGSASLFTTTGILDGTATNPDLLTKSKGSTVYQGMTREPYVKAALLQKQMALLSLLWHIKPASQDPKDIEIAKMVEWSLTDGLIGSFEDDMRETLNGMVTGYSIQEKVWKTVEKGPYKGMWAYDALKSKNPDRFNFALDEFDNIQHLVMMDDKGQTKDLDKDKFLIFSYFKMYENPYGQSDLRAAYRAFYIKDAAWKLRSVYMERYSGNFMKGTYPKGAKDGKNKLLEIFASLAQETGIALPAGYELDVLTMASSSESEYQRAIKDCNKEILIAILGVTLTVDEGQKTGSRALGEVHQKVADFFVLALIYMLTPAINEQLIRPLVDFNYPDVWQYPKFEFESLSGLSTADVKNLIDAGVPISDKWVRSHFRIPEPMDEAGDTGQVFQYHLTSGSLSRNEVRETLGLEPLKGDFYEKTIDPASLMPSSAGEAAAFAEVFDGVAKLAEANIKRYGTVLIKSDIVSFSEFQTLKGVSPAMLQPVVPSPQGTAPSITKPQPAFPEPAKLQEPEEVMEPAETEPFWRPISKFEEDANLEEVDKKLATFEDAAIIASQPAYKAMRSQVLAKVSKKGLLGVSDEEKPQAIAQAGAITVNPAMLNDVLFQTLLTGDLIGRSDQAKELARQGQDFGTIEKFAEVVFDVKDVESPLKPKDAIKAFSGRVPMTKEEFELLAETQKASAFTVAGLEKVQIEKDVRPLIVEAINTGMGAKEFQFRLDKIFTKYINPDFNQVGETAEPTDFHTELVFRNAIMTSYNTGRDAVRQREDIQEAFPANFYSAIMDSRTTSICRTLDGSLFLVNDPAWDSYKPQNHHGCRSILVAINKFDFDPKELTGAPPASVVLPAGFGGN
jgi:SPP1 gp7 family putative phage head morphogenesis protein